MQQRRLLGTVVNVALLVASVLGGWWVFNHTQDIADWWRLRTYTPSAEVAQLADATTMVGRGRDMFYVSDPKVEDKAAFNANCSNAAGEGGTVLGCYALQGIYIYNVNDPRLPGVKQVTAAHEMLHAAYERLDSATRARVEALLQAEMDKRRGDSDLQETIQLYQKTEPGHIINEMHSILGTQYDNLAPELEQYYAQYFSNRGAIVAFAHGYGDVFKASKARIATYQMQLDQLKAQIDANTQVLDQKNATLQQDSVRLNALRSSDTTRYNQEVPPYNAKVNDYNALAGTTQNLINQYNTIVPLIQNELAQRIDLNNSLDSKYQPVPTQ
jgi:hypothetical protein